jgi:hypothetical protein
MGYISDELSKLLKIIEKFKEWGFYRTSFKFPQFT